MRQVKVRKLELRDILVANLTEHRAIFLEAQEKYRELAIAELDRMLEDARTGKKIQRSVKLVEPEDHSDDYARILQMLELEVEDVVVLDAREYVQYVQDDWGWRDQWARNTASYTVAAAKYPPNNTDLF